MNVKTVWKLISETFNRWQDDKAPRLGAALSYYTLFSIAPVLIIVIAVVGLIFGREAVQGEIFAQLGGLVGTTSALAIQDLIKNASQPAASTIATIVGIATLLLGATGVFVELQDALNTIWGVKPKPGRGIMGLVKDRLLSFAMILGVGFLLLVSLVISAGLTALNTFLASMPGTAIVWSILSFVISFAVITVLFAMIFKILPDVRIAWTDVWVGAGVTSILFTIGKFLIGLYLGKSSFASAYGAAGSIVILLVWVYYSSQLVFFGAEFTQVWANYFGSHVVPANNAVPTMQVCAEQELPEARNRDLTVKPPTVVVDEQGEPKRIERNGDDWKKDDGDESASGREDQKDAAAYADGRRGAQRSGEKDRGAIGKKML